MNGDFIVVWEFFSRIFQKNGYNYKKILKIKRLNYEILNFFTIFTPINIKNLLKRNNDERTSWTNRCNLRRIP